MKKSQKILSYGAAALIGALIAALITGLVFHSLAKKQQSKLDYLENLIDERFIGEADLTAAEDAAAAAMVNALGDQWSYYIPASAYGEYLESQENAYVGIGVTVATTGEPPHEILSVTAGGGAEQAGLLAGDVIVAVDGTPTADLDITEVKKRIQGQEGTKVEIKVLRGGEEKTFSVQRMLIRTAVATGTLLEGNVGLVRIENFNNHCAEEAIAAIDSLIGQGAKSLLFDVRNNPGGYASELVKLLDYLLPEGELFRTEDYRGLVHVDKSDANCVDLPMAVLVNGSSYSAAEFFAAALNEYGVAVTVGEKTCGKGYFQNVFPLPDGSAVGLSIGKYFTPKGVSLAGVGVTPKVQVPVDEEIAAAIYAKTLTPEEDPQVLGALNALKNGEKP